MRLRLDLRKIMLRTYDQPWRPAYEWIAGITWLAVIPLYLMIAPASSGVIMKILVCFFALGIGIYRGKQAWENWELKLGLFNEGPTFLSAKKLREHIYKNNRMVWLGTGFDWEQKHTQRLYDLRRINLKSFLPPMWFAKAIGKMKSVDVKPEIIGSAWIRGLETNKIEIKSNIDVFEGHAVVFGAPGSGKTRALEVIVCQAAARKSVVIQFDPKGDNGLAATLEREAKANGVPFVYFHLAFPQKSVRFDALKNFNRVTEFASRTSAVIGSETNDSFSAYSWLIPDAICAGMVMIKEKPSLQKILRYIQVGVGDLLEQVFEAFFKEHNSDWDVMAKRYIMLKMKNPAGRPTQEEKIAGYVEYYKQDYVRNDIENSDVSNLIEIVQNDKQWVGKMLAGLIPVLRMLTAGELGPLLSPDYEDETDTRVIWDFQKVIQSGAIVYIGLDALSDTTICNAVGSLLMAELVSVAGSRYNFGMDNDRKIEILLDEGSNIVNQSFVQVLNKGRGANYVCWLFAQTLQDFTVKLGSLAQAKMLLGNCNNLIALRTKDADTQKYIIEEFGNTLVQSIGTSIAVGDSEDMTSFGDGRLGKTMSEKLEEKIPQDLIGRLPNFNYIANIAGGRLVQGKLPILID